MDAMFEEWNPHRPDLLDCSIEPLLGG